ncbi:MAG: hypothetical protein WC679_00320 [Bacteroidales bacterium]|jgi:hypothetical protein
MDIYELTRRGENICECCNKPKQMYYRPWCPRCEKPTIEMLPTLNLFQALYHLEAIGYTNAKKIVWNYLCDYSNGNDTYLTFNFESMDEEDYDSDAYILLKKLQEVFQIKNEIAFFVSW